MSANTIALLIPGTSNNRNWNHISDSDLLKIFIPSFVNYLDSSYNYKIFFGIDRNDKIYDNEKNQRFIKFILKKNNIDIDFYFMDIEPGYLSKMWNKLFKIAYLASPAV